MTTAERNELNLQAAEYVLGTLETAERTALEQAARANPELRAELAWWERHLGLLALKARPVAPRPIVWMNLQHVIGSAATPRRPARAFALQAWAALATAASILLGFGLYQEMNAPAPVPVVVTQRIEVPVPATTFVALLLVPQSTLQWTVSMTPERGEIAVLAGGEAPASANDRDTELWLIGASGQPVSLGVIPKSGTVRRTLPKGVTLATGGTLAVSLEPLGGSPTGAPTGPVVTTAQILQAG